MYVKIKNSTQYHQRSLVDHSLEQHSDENYTVCHNLGLIAKEMA